MKKEKNVVSAPRGYKVLGEYWRMESSLFRVRKAFLRQMEEFL